MTRFETDQRTITGTVGCSWYSDRPQVQL